MAKAIKEKVKRPPLNFRIDFGVTQEEGAILDRHVEKQRGENSKYSRSDFALAAFRMYVKHLKLK